MKTAATKQRKAKGKKKKEKKNYEKHETKQKVASSPFTSINL